MTTAAGEDLAGRAPRTPAIAAVAYHDGGFVPLRDAHVPVSTQALQYGTGVFEGIRAYVQRSTGTLSVFRAREHFERLLRSARMLRLDVGLDVRQLCDVTTELLRRGGLTDDTYVRPLAYKRALMPGTPPGVQLRGVTDALSVIAFRMGSYGNRGGIRCAISSWRRPASSVLPVRAKVTGGYVNNALAVDEAHAAGYDDAILLNDAGRVTEASTSNVFAVVRGRLVTPPVAAGLLEGITRDTVVRLAADAGLPTEFADLERDDLFAADEVFLTGTGAEIVPVTEIAGRAVGAATVGPLTSRLMEAYQDTVRGDDPRHADWLLPVR
ncbi:branched-chain amino acid transaminase [Streptomyces sp. NBC_01190]|uniref:branched-chain amino acid transaminase n=1 Tax=Streptomyces sp. NBC_01190 TaxID=2903767 RepID=UPI00386B41F7|nr:branched-chain amino acid transaminase [Streptomyces sp. NBC_01190]